MTKLVLPSHDAKDPRRVSRVAVNGNVSISDEQFEGMRKQVDFSESACHVWFKERVQFAGSSFELNGMIGIHGKGKGASQAASKREAYVHYSAELKRGGPSKPLGEGDWTSTLDVLHSTLGRRPLNFTLYLSMAGSPDTAITLPLPLDGSSTPGFAEVRGLRLVQRDPEDPKTELYSLIIDRVSGRTNFQAASSIRTEFKGNALVEAFERGKQIIELGLEAK